MISALFFTWFFAACVWTVNALRRPVPPGRRFPPLWLPGMLVSELAPLYFLARVVLFAGFLALGAGDRPIGVAGIWLFALSQLGLIVLMVRSVIAARATGHSPPVLTLPKVWERLPKEVAHLVEIPYWGALSLDVYAAKASGSPRRSSMSTRGRGCGGDQGDKRVPCSTASLPGDGSCSTSGTRSRLGPRSLTISSE